MLSHLRFGQGTPLPHSLRMEMESFFEADLSRVKLHFDNPAHFPSCSRAFAAGEDIFLAKDCFNPDTPSGRLLLAHELAHVVQNQLGRAGSGTMTTFANLEYEASLVAVCHQFGARRPVVCPNYNYPVLPWGKVGHYYTVLAIALFAGIDDSTASQLAFFAQMPDQVIELDAIPAAVCAVVPSTYYECCPGASSPFDIQQGLHCLNGGDSKAETDTRAVNLVTDNHQLLWKTGLALHAFGDSFAHRKLGDEKRLYPTFFGHSGPGTGVDNISKRKALYRLYCGGMYFILKTVFKSSPVRAEKAIDDFAAIVSQPADEMSQAELIVSEAKLGGRSFPFTLALTYPLESLPWADFYSLHRQMVPDINLIDDFGKTATEWASMRRVSFTRKQPWEFNEVEARNKEADQSSADRMVQNLQNDVLRLYGY